MKVPRNVVIPDWLAKQIWLVRPILFFLICSVLCTFTITAQSRLVSNETALAAQPDNGSIRGIVINDAGKSVSGALITFRHFFAVQGRNQQTTTKTDGSFAIDQLPAGDYAYCIYVPKSEYVDDCQWNTSFVPRVLSSPSPTKIGDSALNKAVLVGDVPSASERIVVPPGGLTSIQQLRVRMGARVSVRFVDGGKLIDSQTHLIVGALTANGMFVSAERSTVGAVNTFQLVIPFDTSVRITISSSLTATGSNGAGTLLPSNLMLVKVAKNDPPLILNYNITGKSK